MLSQHAGHFLGWEGRRLQSLSVITSFLGDLFKEGGGWLRASIFSDFWVWEQLGTAVIIIILVIAEIHCNHFNPICTVTGKIGEKVIANRNS